MSEPWAIADGAWLLAESSPFDGTFSRDWAFLELDDEDVAAALGLAQVPAQDELAITGDRLTALAAEHGFGAYPSLRYSFVRWRSILARTDAEAGYVRDVISRPADLLWVIEEFLKSNDAYTRRWPLPDLRAAEVASALGLKRASPLLTDLPDDVLQALAARYGIATDTARHYYLLGAEQPL
jgi:hypothetical protein